MNFATPVDQWNVVGLGSPLLDLAPGRVQRLKDRLALPPGLFCEPLPDKVHVAPRVVECGGLLDGFALDWNKLQLEQGMDTVSSFDLLGSGRTWDTLAQYI